MFIFHWLRLRPAEILSNIDEVTLKKYVERKYQMNGTIIDHLDNDKGDSPREIMHTAEVGVRNKLSVNWKKCES